MVSQYNLNLGGGLTYMTRGGSMVPKVGYFAGCGQTRPLDVTRLGATPMGSSIAIKTPWKLTGMGKEEINFEATPADLGIKPAGNLLQRTKILSNSTQGTSNFLRTKHYDKTAEFVDKLTNFLQVRGYGHIVEQQYSHKIHGSGFWDSIKGFIKEHKIGSRLLKAASAIASLKYPAVGFALDSLSNYAESKGYGKGGMKLVHV